MTIVHFIDEKLREIISKGEFLHQLVISLNIASSLFQNVSSENLSGIVNSDAKMFASFHPRQRVIAKGEITEVPVFLEKSYTFGL